MALQRRTRLILGGAVGVALLALAVWLAGPARLSRALLEADASRLALALVFTLALVLARGGLWSAILPPTRARGVALVAAAATAVGWLAGHIFPLRAGIVVRAGLLARRTGVPLAGVLSSLAIERGLDFSVTVLLAVAITLALGSDEGSAYLPLVLLTAAALAGGFLLLLLATRARGAAALVPARWRARVGQAAADFRDGLLRLVREPRRLVQSVLWMILVVLAQIACLALLTSAFLPQVPLRALLVVIPWLVVSFYLAFTPSQLGTFEGAFAALMVPAGVPLADALAAGVLIHAALILFAILIGGPAWALYTLTTPTEPSERAALPREDAG